MRPHQSLWWQRPISSLLLLCLQTCGRSSVWSQFSGRGVLAVSSNVCMLWANSGLALLASPADTTHRMSIGNPAARRVTDVERGDCTTFNPYKETGGTISINQQSSISMCSLKNIYRHVSSLTCFSMWAGIFLISASLLLNREAQNLVKPIQHPSTAPWWRGICFFQKKAWVDSDFVPLHKTYPVAAFEKNILEYFRCSH